MHPNNLHQTDAQAGNGRTKKRAANSNAQKGENGKRTEKKPKHSSSELSPSDSLKEKLLNDFSDVLSDELSPTPMKTEKPMHITLKKNHSPFKTLSARRVALRYEEEATKTIEELISKKVITLSLIHISEPTRPLYISYAVFCLKKKKR